jgi:hypothetical protein
MGDGARTRRMAIIAIAVVALLFAVEIVALAIGALEVALACGAVLTAAWFVLRSRRRRGGRTGP